MRRLLGIVGIVLWTTSALFAYEEYSAHVTEKDKLAFDNFSSEQSSGQCYAMASMVADAQYLFKFDPLQPKLSPAQTKQLIESALCTQMPTIIPGFESLHKLSLDHQDILKKILAQYHLDLHKRLNRWGQCYQIITSPIVKNKPHWTERFVNQEEVLNKILSKLKSEEPVVLFIDKTFDQEDETNHALLITGAYTREDGSWEFEYYDPNKKDKRDLYYQNGKFIFGFYSASVGVFEGDLKKYEAQREMANKVREINQKTNQKLTLLGKVEDRGRYIGQKSNYALSFQEKDLYPLVSDRYDLRHLIGKNLALETEFVFSQGNEIEKESGTPVVQVNKAYEIKHIKRIPTEPSVRERFSIIGKLEDRGKFFGRKGAYEIKDENNRTVAVLRGLDHSRALRLLGQDVGILGHQIDREGDLPVLTVMDMDDFMEEVYEEIPPKNP